jgi:hypothetical protein
MSKATVLEFFEACNALMAMPDTKVLSRPPICTLSRPYLIHLMAMPDTKAALQKEFTEVRAPYRAVQRMTISRARTTSPTQMTPL